MMDNAIQHGKKIIFGIGNQASLISGIMKKNGFSPDYFVDNDKSKQTVYEGIRVLSAQELFEMESLDKVNVFITANAVDEIVLQLSEASFPGNVYGVKKVKHDTEEGLMEYVYTIDINKPRLSYIEYEVAGNCNLKCKGCTHYSNMETRQIFGNLENFKSDLKRLKQLFWGIKIIRLLGGEPLLNPEFPSFFITARETFPDAKIQLVTNGLLIPKISHEIYNKMRHYEIEFDITQYPPTSRIKDRIEEILREENIKYYMSPLVEEFFDRNNYNGDSDINESFSECKSKGCHFLSNGKIAVCPRPFTFRRAGDEHNIDKNVLDSDIIDIYSDITGEYLNEKMSTAPQTCRYCHPQKNLRYFKWETTYSQ